MKQNKLSSNVTVSVTMPAEIREEILKMATEGRRSFSNQVSLLLEKQLAIQTMSEIKATIQGGAQP